MTRPCASPRRNGSPCRAIRARGSVFCPYHHLTQPSGALLLSLEESGSVQIVLLLDVSQPNVISVPPVTYTPARLTGQKGPRT